MSKKNISQKQTLRKQQERAALNNIFNVFFAGMGAECLLLLVYRFYVNGGVSSMLAWDSFLRVAIWVGLVVFLLGLGAAIVKKTTKKIRKIGLFTGCSGLFLTMVSFISTRFFETGTTGMLIAVPVVTVLGLVYFLYQRECFVNTTLLAVSLFTLWVCGKGMNGYWTTLIVACVAAVIACMVVVMILLGKIKKNEGMLGDIRIFSPDCDYRVCYVISAVCIASVVLAVLLPSIAFYLTWALVIVLFAELGLFTTKLM